MKQNASFMGKLYGPDLPETGALVSGEWHGDVLSLYGKDCIVQATAQDLHIETAGFNLQHYWVEWPSTKGGYSLMLEFEKEKKAFLEIAPPSLRPNAKAVHRHQRRLHMKFVSVAAIGLMLLILPFAALGLLIWNSDKVVDKVTSFVPVEYEKKLGDIVLMQTKSQFKVIDSGPAHDAVTHIGTRLTAGSPYQYRWYIVENQAVNAFAAPGGVIVVFTGLINHTSSPEELAGVLAHEVAHVELRHSLAQLVKNSGVALLFTAIAGDWSGTALGNAVSKLSQLKFSREAEMEADRVGMEKLINAGISPLGMLTFFEKMDTEKGKARLPALLQTHPSSDDRVTALKQLINTQPAGQYTALNYDWNKVKESLQTGHSVGRPDQSNDV